MKKALARFLAVVALAGLTVTQASAQPQPINVSLELALLVDVSGSISTTEFQLQRDGYVAAFNSAAVHNLLSQITDGIAVTYMQWSESDQQYISVGWTHVYDAATAQAFATAIQGAGRQYSGSTAPGSAINAIMNGSTAPNPDILASQTFAGNNFNGASWVIDVSGDGEQNDGANTATARNNALAAGVDRINGLVIGGDTLQAWYNNNVVGGVNAFSIRVDSFDDLAPAIERKLSAEITGGSVPEGGPGMALFGLALAGLAALRRKLN